MQKASSAFETSFLLAFLFILTVFCMWQESNFLATNANGLSFIYFTALFIFTAISPKAGLVALAFFLPLSPAWHIQVNAIFQTNLQAAHHPGLDLTAGFISGYLLNKLFWKDFRFNSPPGSIWIFAAYSYIVFSTLLSIARNLWQSASVTNLSGILFNLSDLRNLGWHDDFFPLKDLFAYSLAFGAFFAAYDVLAHEIKRKDHIFIPLLLSSFVLSAYAFAQYAWHIGIARSGFDRGIDSFFPDLHSLAGFMLIPVIGSYFYAKESNDLRIRVLCAATGLSAAVTMILSQSRFTLVIVFIAIATFIIQRLTRKRDAKTIIGSCLLVVGCVAFTLLAYFKSLHFQNGLTSVMQASRTLTFNDINLAFTYRPELFLGAFRMFSSFPIIGLGQGEFNRSSRLYAFAQTDYYTRVGGENAHNYFLQTLTELGILGFLLLTILLCLPLLKKRGFALTKAPLCAIIAIFCGNIFAHSLLEREMLIILALFIALYFAEAKDAGWSAWVEQLQSLSRKQVLRSPIMLPILILVVGAGIELATSFKRPPYTFGSFCFEKSEIYADGWTSGRAAFNAREGTQQGEILYEVEGHKLLKYFPLYVDYDIRDKDKNVLKSASVQANGRSRLELETQPQQTFASVELHVSHCLVPKNVGINGDARHLGIRVNQTNF